MKTKAVKYKIGSSSSYGRLVLKPRNLIEVPESQFYELLERSVNNYNNGLYRSEAFKKSNLREGVTIGTDYYIIEKCTD